MKHQIDLPRIAAIAAELRAMLGEDYDGATFIDTLDGETNAADILGWLAQSAEEAEAFAETNKALAATYTHRAQRWAAARDAHRAAIGRVLDAIGERKVTLPTATVSRTAPRPKLEITDPNEVPRQLCVVSYAPDRAAIRAQLDDGEKVPGARLVMGEAGVMVRTR